MQKWQSFKWSWSSCHKIRTAKDIDLWVPLNQPAKVLQHDLQQILSPQTLSWSLILSQNTVHKLFSWVWTVASFVILVPLHCKCGRSYSVYFDKNVTCCTQEKCFWNTQGNCPLHWYNTQDGGWNQTEVLRHGSTTYYCAKIYHRHLVMPT